MYAHFPPIMSYLRSRSNVEKCEKIAVHILMQLQPKYQEIKVINTSH